MNHRYLVATGYFNRFESGLDWFWPIWWRNTMQATPAPERVLVIAMGGHKVEGAEGVWVKLDGDTQNKVGAPYPANQVMLCAAAMVAWLDECDLIYKEQDLLAFGPWVERMYAEIGDRKMIYGKFSNGFPWAQNSLCLIKHEWLLDFVRWFLTTEPVRADNIHETSAEAKFYEFAIANPHVAGFYSFGYDRERPFDINANVWSVQKLTAKELLKLRASGLITFEGEPPYKREFSNTQHPDVHE